MTENRQPENKHAFRPLEELNLIDNFLFQQMLSCEDGARKIILYTKGTEGTASQPLKDMLKYIQESTEKNVTNQDISSIQQFVNKVKHKKEVGINYMKSWEVEEEIRKESYHEGFEDGFEDGFDDGYDDGFDNGTEKMSRLIICLTEAGRTEDITKVLHDAAYRKQLFEEFDL